MPQNSPTATSRLKTQVPETLSNKVKLTLLNYSESSFTDPHTVVSFDDPRFDENAYSHIGKTYEGVEPHRMGGHHVKRNANHPKECTHHFDPNHRDFFVVKLEGRTLVKTLCISTRYFAGNPASDLRITLFDDLNNDVRHIPASELKPDSDHWIDEINCHATRIALYFKAGGITRLWTYGSKAAQQPKPLSWLSKDSTVLFKEDDFFGGPNFALSQAANRSNPHMLGWETSRSAMGLRAVFPISRGVVKEVVIDTYRHVNNYLRSAWVFSADLPEGHPPQQKDCPVWQVTSSGGQTATTHDLKDYFKHQHEGKDDLPTYKIQPKANHVWRLETTFQLSQDAMHIQSQLNFKATHICIMLLPHGGLHAIRVMGLPL